MVRCFVKSDELRVLLSDAGDSHLPVLDTRESSVQGILRRPGMMATKRLSFKEVSKEVWSDKSCFPDGLASLLEHVKGGKRIAAGGDAT